MKRADFYISSITTIWLIIIIFGFMSGQDVTQRSNATQNSTLTTSQPVITAEVGEGLVKLNHTGGDSVFLSNVTIIIEQGNASAIYERPGQDNDKFAKGDTLYLTPDNINLNGRALDNGKILINNSGVTGDGTTITLVNLPGGNILAKIVSYDGFFR